MTILYLIRHGQASLHGDNYDVLSEQGHAQARAIGQAMATEEPFGRGERTALTRLVAGPLSRQQDTATQLLDGMGTHAQELTVETNPAFSEYPAFEIFAHAFDALRNSDPDFAALADGQDAPHKSLPIFAALIERWVDGKIDLTGTTLETFAAFQARVTKGLETLMTNSGKGDSVAVVTSGGPIGVSVGHVLGLDPHGCMRLCWRIANASITRIERLPNGRGLVLSGLNGISHLPPSVRTWV